MRVKIGHQWFEVTPEAPLMVELEDWEKSHLSSLGSANRYACFDADDGRTVSEREKWMRDGATPRAQVGIVQ